MKKAAVPRAIRQIGRYIVADSRVCHGKLTFRGTRIFVSDVLKQVERGLPWDTIVKEWEGRVPEEAIAEAVRLARESLLGRVSKYSGPGGQQEAVCEMLRFAENNRTTLTGISVKELIHEGHDL